MENTHKRLTALNADSIRTLVNAANERDIQKEDVLSIIQQESSYYLLYYQEGD